MQSASKIDTRGGSGKQHPQLTLSDSRDIVSPRPLEGKIFLKISTVDAMGNGGFCGLLIG